LTRSSGINSTVPRPLDKAQINLSWIRLGDPVNERALFNAIAAPDAAEDQNFHFPHKAADKLL